MADGAYSLIAPLLRRAPKQESAAPPWLGLHPAANAHRVIRAGTFAILVIFGGFGAWAATAPLSGAVIGRGVIKVDLNLKTVQHLEGGIIREIRVRDGVRVQAGDTLLVVGDERVDASVDVLQGQLDWEMAKAARMEAERTFSETIQFPEALLERIHEPKVAELIRTETEYFNTRRRALDEQLALLEEQIHQAYKEIESLKMRSDAELAAAALLEQEIEANEALAAQQYVQKTRLLELKRGIEEYKARRGEHLRDMARAEQHISDLGMTRSRLKDQYVEQAAEDLTTTQAKIFDLQERLRPSRDAKRRQHIVAPISGTVMNMSVFTIGGVIRPGEPLLQIVPENKDLIVEARIPVESIDDVHVGQDADVQLSAYKRRSTPLVAGKLTYVSADRIDPPDGRDEPYYLTHVTVSAESLAEIGDVMLYPGMPAEVYIKTDERTALDYMLTPLTQTLRRSLREP